MHFNEIIRAAIDSLIRHKTRALLTMLGIVIGVAAVVAMVAVGNGAQIAVETQIASLGTNVLMVFPGAGFQGPVSMGAGQAQNLTLEDVDAIREQCPAVGYVTPSTRTNRQVVAGNLNWATQIQGGGPEFFAIRDWPLQAGMIYTEQDERAATKVCVIGQTIAENLYPEQDPIGQTIRIAKLPFKVVGLLSAKGQNAMGQDQDDIIVAPFSTVQKKVQGSDRVSMIIMSAATQEQIAEAQSQVSDLFRIRHKISSGQSDDFTIRTQTEIAATAGQTTKIMSVLLGSIASVSLLVGGIGIMNIMLVSVTERTREIGVRRSLGARKRDILQQFLVEAILLSIIGGLVGIGLGVFISSLISKFAGWPVAVTADSVLLAFVFSAAVGMFFGFYPARKAAVINPIDALRYE
jgi:putative ABC transport system permease protein